MSGTYTSELSQKNPPGSTFSCAERVCNFATKTYFSENRLFSRHSVSQRSAPTVTESARESVATRESVKFIPDYYSAYSNHHA